MEQYRENVVRGTPDFPFAQYHLTSKHAVPDFNHIHWHPEMEILYMQQGTAEVRTGKNYFLFNEGDAAIIHPNELHAIRPLGANCKHSAFVFSLDLVTLPDHHFFQASLIRPLRAGLLRFPQHITPQDPCYPVISEALDRICSCKRETDRYKLTVFHSLLTLFTVLSSHPALTAQQKDPHNETVKSCIQFMEENFKSQLSLAQISGHVHLHPNYLCKLFRSYTGQTVFEYLIRIRIESAARMLRTTNLSVSQIAAECGFDSVSFFTRKFKTIMGITPKHYSLQYFEGVQEKHAAK